MTMSMMTIKNDNYDVDDNDDVDYEDNANDDGIDGNNENDSCNITG